MTDRELRDQLVTLLLAGHETTATAIAWAVERLTRHPVVMDRLVAHLDDGDTNYLDAVIKETLRSRPVVAQLGRVTTEEVVIDGWTVPPRTMLIVPMAVIHQDPDLYPDPDAFRPERFLDGSDPGRYTWLPFGGGVRRCPGASLALLEMRQILATILRGVELAPDRPEDEQRKVHGITVWPARDCRVRVVAAIEACADDRPRHAPARRRDRPRRARGRDRRDGARRRAAPVRALRHRQVHRRGHRPPRQGRARHRLPALPQQGRASSKRSSCASCARYQADLADATASIADPEDQLVEGFAFTVQAIRSHRLLQRLLETEPEELLPHLTTNGAPFVELGRGFLAARMAATLDDGRTYEQMLVAADIVARLLISYLITPGAPVDFDDPAAAREFARTYLVRILEGDA